MHVRHLRMDVECSLHTLFLQMLQDSFCIFDFEYRYELILRRLDRDGELVPAGSYSWIFLRLVLGGGSFAPPITSSSMT